MLAEVHQQVACLLGGPPAGGMLGDAEDADAPAAVLDHGQDVSLGAAGQAGGEEVARQDRLGLGAQELRPGFPGPARRGLDPGIFHGLPWRRCRCFAAAVFQLPVDSCGTVQSLVGCAVTPPRCILRVPCSMNTSTYSLLSPKLRGLRVGISCLTRHTSPPSASACSQENLGVPPQFLGCTL